MLDLDPYQAHISSASHSSADEFSSLHVLPWKPILASGAKSPRQSSMRAAENKSDEELHSPNSLQASSISWGWPTTRL